MEEKVTNQMCPDCSELTMLLLEGTIMHCVNCGASIPLDIYMMSLEIIEKDLIIELLKLFLLAGTGRCIQYNGKPFIIGFDQDYDLITQKYLLQLDLEIGMYVKIFTNDQGELN